MLDQVFRLNSPPDAASDTAVRSVIGNISAAAELWVRASLSRGVQTVAQECGVPQGRLVSASAILFKLKGQEAISRPVGTLPLLMQVRFPALRRGARGHSVPLGRVETPTPLIGN